MSLSLSLDDIPSIVVLWFPHLLGPCSLGLNYVHVQLYVPVLELCIGLSKLDFDHCITEQNSIANVVFTVGCLRA